jgi:hypothetical protein
MKKTSAKNKLVMLAIAWIVVSCSMFLYFFNFLDASNRQTVNAMQGQKKSLAALQGQQQSFELAKSDLDKLAAQPVQPDNFFSRDITLVNEIQTLEDWSQKLNVNMQLSGLSGTIALEPNANTITPIAQVPYAISLKGSLSQVTDFFQVLENLSFVTNVVGVSVSAEDSNSVNASLSAEFYLRK